ncbi:serine hydrolase [Erythrobacter sp.]|uniref:serine hydrolase domain-containing protein n=1 Tax=Erythrobacter sp. TaxID=1042 RepID=UPI001425E527|nr:serine hydrolase [Erythrobacter sp.]QIQ86586.1 MAG: serine hydrolase [Erythrobacter sp.]
MEHASLRIPSRPHPARRLVSASGVAILAGALAAGACAQDSGAQDIAAPAPAPAAMAEAESRTAYPPEDEALYLARFNQLLEAARTGAGLGSYDPLEPVAGASDPQPLPRAERPALSAEALAEAESYAAARNSSAFIVMKDGAIQHETYFGETTRDTPIVSRSLAKPVTALLVGRAIMQGHIASLDQPVADFITEWQGDAQREKILVRHLLDMRTGLLPQGFSREPEDILNRAYLHPRHDEVIINDYPLTHEPGTRYEYSNANSELVAPVIERATGMRYSEYLTEALLEPIGASGGEVWVNREGGTAHSGCCLMLPAQSWLRMAMLVMNDGEWEGERLLPEGYAEAMRTATDENPHYGMGVWVAGPYVPERGFAHPSVPYGKVAHSEPYLDRDLTLFDGNGNQVVYMIPSQRMIVLRTGSAPPKDMAWDNTVLPNLLIRDAARLAGEPLPEPQE